MLQLTDGRIVESFIANQAIVANAAMGEASGSASYGITTTSASPYDGNVSNCLQIGNYQVWPYQTWPYQTIWQSYPVYVCSDKTAKAIEILKTLQKEKKIRCDSVPKFIDLVEKIAAIL